MGRGDWEAEARDPIQLGAWLKPVVEREVDSELKRQGLKPLALAIALSVGDRKASALIRGHDV